MAFDALVSHDPVLVSVVIDPTISNEVKNGKSNLRAMNDRGSVSAPDEALWESYMECLCQFFPTERKILYME